MDKIKFLIQGSAKTPYEVTIYIDKSKIINDARCTCPAGKRGGLICRHIMAIFAGDTEELVSDNVDELIDLFYSADKLNIKDLYYNKFLNARSISKRTNASKQIRELLTKALPNRRREI